MMKVREQHCLKLDLQCADKGRSFHLIHQDQSSNHWIPEGKYTSFSAYRFAIKARLNFLPVKTVVRRAGKSVDTKCPKCSQKPLDMC